jgi:cation:H+ antiporter
MILDLAGIVLGIALLVMGGTALVSGASQIAARYGVSPLVIGLTIVAFGTSAPELVINVLSSARGQTELAFGNVIGSNIGNLALILGLAAVVRPIEIHVGVVRREIPLLLLITSIMIVMALDGVFEGLQARIGRSDAVVLLLLFGIFVYITMRDILTSRKQDPLLEGIERSPNIERRVSGNYAPLLLALGFTLLFIGGEITVRCSVSVAERLGISAALIGIFVVAIGTSMPELVTSIVAARRRESDLAVGNVIGSNIFNSLIVLPASALTGNVLVPRGGVLDLLVSWLLAAVLVPIFFFGKARLSRSAGVVFLMAYLGYAAVRIFGNPP